jgi:hypothetical protein
MEYVEESIYVLVQIRIYYRSMWLKVSYVVFQQSVRNGSWKVHLCPYMNQTLLRISLAEI